MGNRAACPDAPTGLTRDQCIRSEHGKGSGLSWVGVANARPLTRPTPVGRLGRPDELAVNCWPDGRAYNDIKSACFGPSYLIKVLITRVMPAKCT